MRHSQGTLDQFIEAACVPRQAGHTTGTLDRAQALLTADPDLPRRSVHAAAVLGDADAVRDFIRHDAAAATSKGGPHGWDPLTYLCFSTYLRLDASRTPGFVRAATALLDAGASANTGWFEDAHLPRPVWESAIYGAAGIARNAELTRLLLERGADPNDDETPYHAPEGYDNGALHVLVRSGKLTADSLSTILLRKADWHDYDGIAWLLRQGVDPNYMGRFGKTALHQAVLRDNALEIIQLLLDHGADPTLAERPSQVGAAAGRTAVAIAARRGRDDVLALFERRGVPLGLEGVDRLVAACARDDGDTIRLITTQQPELTRDLVREGGRLLVEFAAVGNTAGVRQLLDLGIVVDAHHGAGDGYYDVTEGSTALHVAAWRARHAAVRYLLERGANVNARDDKARTPLMLAVKACVDSYWTERRSPESVEILLRAGASAHDVRTPTGYPPVDELLAQSQATEG